MRGNDKVSDKPKIFCIGLPKSGTTTFGDCMKRLGYRHKGGPIEAGAAAVSMGRPQILDPIIRGADSFDDTPWPFVYEYAARKYPGSKFVLTRRKDPQVWLRSLMKHSRRVGATNALRLTFGHYELDGHEDEMIAFYEDHMSRARDFFAGSPDFIELCWEEGDGWDALCGFLGQQVPGDPFPKSNAADAKTEEQLVLTMCERGRLASAIEYARRSETPEPLLDIVERHLGKKLKPSFGMRRIKKMLKV